MVTDIKVIKKGFALDSIASATYLGTKRFVDVCFGMVGVVCMLPLAVAIKISYILNGDFKSIFYTQMRIGQYGKEFKFYKFRSMIPDADKALEKLLAENPEAAEEYRINKKLANDPRITKMGKFIRKTSIDEVPQFINILKGDMTLIGNRPYLPRERADMGDFYSDIVITKPGLTGLWQTAGRSNVTFNRRLKLEKYYSNNMSFALDMRIFFDTFKVVFLKKGAK